MEIQGLGQVEIVADDVDRATTFYRDVLGIPFLFSAPPGLAFFDCGGVRLMISNPQEEGAERGMASLLYYRVESVRDAVEVMRGRGADPISGPLIAHRTPDYWLWLASYHDTEGNTFALMSEEPPEAATQAGVDPADAETDGSSPS